MHAFQKQCFGLASPKGVVIDNWSVGLKAATGKSAARIGGVFQSDNVHA
jgi:hypothetical protein